MIAGIGGRTVRLAGIAWGLCLLCLAGCSPQRNYESLLVLDATTGQNALAQARAFKEAVGLTGVVLSKLDGSAKGGMTFAIRRELGLPLKLVGTGEQLEDLDEFDPEKFVAGLLD